MHVHLPQMQQQREAAAAAAAAESTQRVPPAASSSNSSSVSRDASPGRKTARLQQRNTELLERLQRLKAARKAPLRRREHVQQQMREQVRQPLAA
jgi:hypothetical protein